MPPPSYCSKVSTRSTGDHEPEIDNDIEKSKSEISNYAETAIDDDSNTKYDSVGIVKSLLGPSLEDAVLRTLEFGKSLIQKADENEPKKMFNRGAKKDTFGNSQKQNTDFLIDGEDKRGTEEDMKNCPECKADKDVLLYPKPNNTVKKLTNVSKIRSLDSDLKQVSPSPEKIKRQLEALIQIHKGKPTEHLVNWNVMSKTPKLPLEMTVMPTFCNYKNEVDLNCSSSCDVHSQNSRRPNDEDLASTSRMRTSGKKRLGTPNKICQAPEFLSNALGPTLDVSIIDNLKMMRDIFKCDSAKSECLSGRQETSRRMTQMRPDVQIQMQRSEEEMSYRVEELQKRIEELEHKEECLVKQIEEEDREREVKKRAFEEEERRLMNMKACLESFVESNGKEGGTLSFADGPCEGRYECLQARVAAEEEKLSRLKDQYENYKRDLTEAKAKKESLKRNKSLLDAWDVIASRVCHTRLPSFSKAYDLGRKCFQQYENPELHCCLPIQMTQPVLDPSKVCASPRKSRSRSRGRNKNEKRCQSTHDSNWGCKPSGSQSPPTCRKKYEDIPFPIQRDITCGLHQSLKTCSCSHEMRAEGVTCSSEDDLFKKYAAHRDCKRENCCYPSSLDTSAEILLRKPPRGKSACRSKSDTTLRNKCAKIVKVLWAVTRINIFQDNCRTYEVMDATATPPPCAPARTEGIFVVKSSQKKCAQSPSKRKCQSNCSGP